MGQFMIRRTLYALITLFILSLTIFTVVRLTGDPVTLLAEPGARRRGSRPHPRRMGARPAVAGAIPRLRQERLHRRAWASRSTTRCRSARCISSACPIRCELALAATLISFVIGIPAGIISAVRVNSAWDNVGKIIALLGLAVPGFWLGLVMILVFSVWLDWLPTSGQGGWRNLIMPAVALGWYFAASLLRLTRSSMLEVLRSEYIKLARLKGLPGYVVIAVHAFKNALIPVLTLAGVNLVVMINAAVIIEVIFAWPGIGRLLYEGIFQRDFPLVQGVVMEAGIMIVLINLIVDILYAYIDPRIRLTR